MKIRELTMFTKDHTPGAVQEGEVASPEERVDWGQVNRQLLADKLRKAYFERTPLYPDQGTPTTVDEQWLNVANEAISEILGDAK